MLALAKRLSGQHLHVAPEQIQSALTVGVINIQHNIQGCILIIPTNCAHHVRLQLQVAHSPTLKITQERGHRAALIFCTPNSFVCKHSLSSIPASQCCALAALIHSQYVLGDKNCNKNSKSSEASAPVELKLPCRNLCTQTTRCEAVTVAFAYQTVCKAVCSRFCPSHSGRKGCCSGSGQLVWPGGHPRPAVVQQGVVR